MDNVPAGESYLVDRVVFDDGSRLDNAAVILDDRFLVAKDAEGKLHWYNRNFIVALHGVTRIDREGTHDQG